MASFADVPEPVNSDEATDWRSGYERVPIGEWLLDQADRYAALGNAAGRFAAIMLQGAAQDVSESGATTFDQLFAWRQQRIRDLTLRSVSRRNRY